MINPVHRLKKFVKYAGNEKPSSCYLTEAVGWLGSGIKDENGVEIFEGDILADRDRELFEVVFNDGQFQLQPYAYGACVPLIDFAASFEVIGHIAEEQS